MKLSRIQASFRSRYCSHVPAETASVTSFVCRMHGRVAGTNWLITGEAAAMVDPMTANGVTAALRHASEASRILIESRRRQRIPYLAAAMYSRRVLGLAMNFNRGIVQLGSLRLPPDL